MRKSKGKRLFAVTTLVYLSFEFFMVKVLNAPVIHYSISTAGNNEVFQIYNTSSLTRQEAEVVCKRCKNGGLPIITTAEIDSFVNTMFTINAITTGVFWLGLKYPLFTWKWDNDSGILYEKWASGHPASGTKYAEVDIADMLWYSRVSEHRQSDQAYVVCQYTNSNKGLYETEWGGWESCDAITQYQVRTKLCMSPAEDSLLGCTCEDYQKDYQSCSETSVNIQENDSRIYQLYDGSFDWYQAEQVCSRCETGTIMQQYTAGVRDFVVDNVISGNGWLDSYFVGLTTELVAGVWTWLDMTLLSWNNWVPLNPSSDVSKTVTCAMKLTSHEWYNCRKKDVVNALVCQYDALGKGTYGAWQTWGPCIAMPWIGSGIRYRVRRCISPVNTTTTTGCTCEDVQKQTQACPTALKAIYNRSDDVYVMFEAGGTGMFAQQLCSSWCSGSPGTLVQYQTAEEYDDLYNNLILPNLPVSSTLRNHFIGLSDETTEGVWRWDDGSQLPWNWALWAPGEPSTGFLKGYVIMYADLIPQARTAMNFGSSTASLADFVVCEYAGVGVDGVWSAWSAWSFCSSLNTTSRSRTCIMAVPTLTGCQCVGVSTEEEACEFKSTTTTLTPATTTTTASTVTTTSSSLSSSAQTTTTTANTTILSSSLSTTTTTTLIASSISTDTPLTTSSVPTSTTGNIECFCPCLFDDGYSELSPEEKLAKLIKDLTLDKQNLSAVRRRKTSAYDDRTSAISIGICGCTVLGFSFLTIIIIDFRRIVISSKYLLKRFGRVSQE